MVTGILKVVSMKRKKDDTAKDLESKSVKGTRLTPTGDFESKTDEKTLEYAKQCNKGITVIQT